MFGGEIMINNLIRLDVTSLQAEGKDVHTVMNGKGVKIRAVFKNTTIEKLPIPHSLWLAW